MIASARKLTGVLLLLTSIGAPQSLQGQTGLLLGPDSLTTAPNRIVLALPDSGGFLLNQMPVDSASLQAMLQFVYTNRPRKVLLILPGVKRTDESAAWAATTARQLGITVFLADRAVEAGWRRAI